MATRTSAKMNVYEIVTDRFLSALDKGIVPWRKPWNSKGTSHTNLKSKKGYRGVNQMLLTLTALSEGYTSPYWVSYKQAAEMGGQVRKGEKSTVITFWKMLDDKRDPNGKKIPMLRYYRVFNVEQCDNLESKIPAPDSTDQIEFNPCENSEKIVGEYLANDGPKLSHGSNKAAYTPLLDAIKMPNPEDFHSSEEYYSTLFHELSHSTGAKERLNRDGIVKPINFGSDPYAEEELIAEMSAAFLCSEVGILDTVFDNSVAYIQGWKKKLEADPKIVVKAAGRAQKSADLILGIDWNKVADTATETEDEDAA